MQNEQRAARRPRAAALGRRAGAALAVAGLAAPVTLLAGGQAQAATSCTTQTGPYQRQVESYLKLKVDGRQSPTDCRAIQSFQVRYGITPHIGYAGPITWGKMQELQARANPNASGACPVNKGRIACVDLKRQLVWVQYGKKVIFNPVRIRSGRDGYETRTGLKRVYWRHIDHYSTLYHVAMPYSQFFDGGQAFHGVSIPISQPPGSHGCVNMTNGDARRLWGVLKLHDYVYVWGKRPGT
ncbi:L,D-transpeptidase [Streptacidiphilus sp. ASG 303]|uniref:L,D-transpeptidase family protein n=1 Tax=Streptomycetaceae TaxID=2062 RepID=UPI001E289B02|nr:L,D-transpeptidase [Streptacidiphilus sp. ASG 303]MCD0481951.1 L,D-transpeptidase [Streptacidiphilus sp. ASG 303]